MVDNQYPRLRGKLLKSAAKFLGSALLVIALMTGFPDVSSAIGKGAKGPDVYVIQGMLKSLGSYAGPIDGNYNALTVIGVKYYQKKHGLPATGSVDKRTLKSLIYVYASKKTGTQMHTQSKGNGKIREQGIRGGKNGGIGGGQGHGGGTGGGQGKNGGIGGGQGHGGGTGGGQG
ncbi:peptidoglycan-binding protein, partial [Paenibacillus sepulcri]|nr:peptidoglycan-binding protein [Paenibacillus sepulcri]